jgi:hypothetical protein
MTIRVGVYASRASVYQTHVMLRQSNSPDDVYRVVPTVQYDVYVFSTLSCQRCINSHDGVSITQCNMQLQNGCQHFHPLYCMMIV